MDYLLLLEKVQELNRIICIERTWHDLQTVELKDQIGRLNVEVKQLQIQLNVLAARLKQRKQRFQ